MRRRSSDQVKDEEKGLAAFEIRGSPDPRSAPNLLAGGSILIPRCAFSSMRLAHMSNDDSFDLL
jgi:hypothetical protein